MMLTRRSLALGSAAVATTTLALGPDAVAVGRPRPHRSPTSSEGGQIVLDWERVLFRTVYTDLPVTPIPVGVPVLGFTSLAMYNAATRSAHVGSSSESAAVARAAHDVLVHYYPAKSGLLAADLTASLGGIPAGPARAKGERIGADAAAELIASRRGDNYLSTAFHYSKPPGPGVWQPNPGTTDMLAPWLGNLAPLVVAYSAPAAGPYALDSAAYAADLAEVRRLGGGGATPTDRQPSETATAQFFNSNSATTVGDALVRYLEAHPQGVLATAKLFATMHVAMTTAAIRCWGLKRDVGFWRPSAAIAAAGDPSWTPLVPNPPYSDYVSGHACLTGPAVEVIRQMLGEGTALELRSVNSPTPRVYAHLSDIEFDAYNARIWSGLHFRKAMTDGYDIAHRTAEHVIAAFS